MTGFWGKPERRELQWSRSDRSDKAVDEDGSGMGVRERWRPRAEILHRTLFNINLFVIN